jgi:hypothetical protein
MDKRLPHFQVYGQSKIIVDLVEMHQYVGMCCEQYIECITSISHLKRKWLHIDTWYTFLAIYKI